MGPRCLAAYSPRRAQTIRGRLIDVVDGDTLRVRPLTRTLRRRYERLVGIDTPETNRPGTPVECGGPEATAGLTRLAEARPVRLRTDPFQDTFDRYGRLLAYAKLRGGPDLALTQLRRGWAEMYAYGDRPFRGLREPRRAERSARRAGRAVWSKMRWRLPRPASSSAGTAALLRGTHACPDLSIVVTTKASTVSTSGAPSAMGLPFSCQMPLSYIASVQLALNSSIPRRPLELDAAVGWRHLEHTPCGLHRGLHRSLPSVTHQATVSTAALRRGKADQGPARPAGTCRTSTETVLPTVLLDGFTTRRDSKARLSGQARLWTS